MTRRDELRPWLRNMPVWVLRAVLVAITIPVWIVWVAVASRDEFLPILVQEWIDLGRIDNG